MEMKIKLKLMPNINKILNSTPTNSWFQIAFSLYIPILLISIVNCVDLSPQTPIISAAAAAKSKTLNETSAPKFNRDVKDLKLTADFRAVKLRWSYDYSEAANEPASFDIRYCELTSWDIEIKCRHRDLKVTSNLRVGTRLQQLEKLPNTTTSTTTNNDQEEKSVIPVKRLYPIETVQQLDSPNQYEVQIFDLRALTNYTFQVHVSRFLHEPEQPVQSPASKVLNQTKETLEKNSFGEKSFSQLERRNRVQAARRLNNIADEQHSDDAYLRRIETKPFGAEATKCLADVSEVVINTGKYFGGRISVEDSSDPRCNLIGNKTSEQTSYLFRIDHHICDSKIVDGNRIETMVLVHENKDILTHNTARFLVLCNFLQKSFTLRASISLPKVNGILPQSRPAVITSLPQRPFDNNSNNVTEDHSMSILLGSMPGVYRARSAAAAAATSLSQQQQQQQGNTPNTISSNNKANSYTTILDEHLQQQVNQDVNRSSLNSNINHIVDELETNTIEKFIDKKSSRSSGQDKSVQAKSNTSTNNNNNNSSSSSSSSSSNILQQVVERQSKQLAEGAPFSQHNSGIGGREGGGGGNNLLATMLNNNNNYKPSSTLNSVDSQRARSLTLSSLDANINNKLPQPVQVQSKLLFVGRSNPASRVGRQQQQHLSKPITIQANLVERSTSSQFDTLESGTSAVMQIPTTTVVPPTNIAAKTVTTTTPLQPDKVKENENEKDVSLSASRNLKQWPRNKQQVSSSVQQQQRQQEEVGVDLQLKLQQSPSIIMTNNHRIPGDYLPLAQATTSLNSKPTSGIQSNTNSNNFSIKYSAAKVDEFPVGQGDVEVPLVEPVSAGTNHSNNTSRTHGGRMRSLEDELHLRSSSSSQSKGQAKVGSSWTVDNRMGEVMGSFDVASRSSNNNNSPAEPQQADLLGETSNNEFSNDVPPQTGVPAVNGTLAQNITSFLLKWSLRTLTNLARKSFESLAIQNGSQIASSLNNSDFESENEPHEYEQRNEPIRTVQMRVNQLNDHRNQPVVSPYLDSSPKPSSAPQTQSQPQKANVTNNDRNHGGSEIVSLASVATAPSSHAKIVPESKREVIPSTIKPAQINTSVKLLDDFMTSTSQVEELPKISTASPQIVESLDNYHNNHHQQHQHNHAKQNNHSRPSNYSKSLDFAKIAGESTSHRPKNSEKNNIGKSNHHSRQRNQQPQQSIEEQLDKPIQSNRESAWTNRDTFYSSWMFYGLLLFIAIITGIFFTFWLVSMPLCDNKTKVKTSSRHNVHNHNENHSFPDPQTCLQSQQRLVFKDSITPQATLKLNHPTTNVACIVNNSNNNNNNNNNSPRSRSLLDISYQKYDYNKFENYQNDVTSNNINSSAFVHVNNNVMNGNSNNKIISNNNNIHGSGNNQNKSNCDNREDKITARELIGRLDQQSPSSTSLRTRSTSAGSTIMVDENDCKNNEFLYTEHVLINPGLSFGESYA